MLLLAENFTLKVLTRLAHKVLGISKLKYIIMAIPNNMHVISVKHCHKKAVNEFHFTSFTSYAVSRMYLLTCLRCRRTTMSSRRRDDDVRLRRTYITGFSVIFLCKYLPVCLTRCGDTT